MNSTLVGSIAVITWGISVPLVRIPVNEIGALPFLGLLFGSIGILTLVFFKFSNQKLPSKALILSPIVWLRGIFFVLHEALLYYAIFLVQQKNMPMVILLNYLWPTCIILCSIAFAGVKITRWWAFVVGTTLVIYSLSLELLGDSSLNHNIFESKSDRIAYLLVSLGAFSWGMYCALSRRFGDSSGGGSVIPIYQLVLGLALPISFFTPDAIPWNLSPLGLAILITFIIADFVGYLAWDHGMRKGNVVILSLFADFIPWISLFTATFVLDITLSSSTLLSAALLVLGGMITRYGTLNIPNQPNHPSPS